ncbi:hypothetical protein CWI42_070420 [Ordospora colligata]|uniref:OB domain-containing protein n=1 Tax=Ordospora colligata OC4 TaxID=1354746 RepID=A0A0B2UJP6_9MICR|nr:uncharacterized protein M896_070420 [Ordospora colligata OC4]KHN69474.1 hypothetical protein M896_070420 [Ordospora colligata OC4]TBU15218.1 hypothetical protein CWI41_070420 [Ordospora colligata]TBU15289.1 hypothetical protein CWI40_070420 [Ordospora colligata]TBU18471.1 hypothetical protein CWI42_070420 [Ordospora colligata]
MDDLLSQIRGTQVEDVGECEDSSLNQEEVENAVCNPFEENKCTVNQEDSDSNDILCSLDNLCTGISDEQDPTSSQTHSALQIIKLDFELLEQLKIEHNISTGIRSIKNSKAQKIECEFAGIIKKLDKFGKDVVFIEITDQDGSMSGSCTLADSKELELKVGSILVLEGCSLWKVNGNHLNITSLNIKKVI